MKRKPCKVERRSLQEIADCLYESIREGNKVALILVEDDLMKIINALDTLADVDVACDRQIELLDDLKQLHARVFP